jgi:hypothetical protein
VRGSHAELAAKGEESARHHGSLARPSRRGYNDAAASWELGDEMRELAKI